MINTQNSPLVVVIGGGHGIGEASCRVLAAQGWRLVVADKDGDAAAKVAADIGAVSRPLDVTDPEQIRALADSINKDVGPVEGLVVSSGAFQSVLPPEEVTAELWQHIMNVNVVGVFNANTAFAGHMRKRRRGSIVNVASITGETGAPTHAYAPSKAAVINMTQNLACEWGQAGIRVNAVSPGVTLVPRILDRWAAGGGTRATTRPEAHAALGRCVEPTEVAQAIAFLISDQASAITGISLPVDAGWQVASGWEMYGGPRRYPDATDSSGASRSGD